MENDFETHVRKVKNQWDNDPKLSEEEKKKLNDFVDEKREKLEVLFDIATIINPLREFEAWKKQIEAVEYDISHFDAYWGFYSEYEAIQKYERVASAIADSSDISDEEKRELRELIDVKIKEIPQRIKECHEQVEREEEEQRLAWEDAKERYSKLSIWGKMKCMMNKQTPRKLVPETKFGPKVPDMSTSKINRLYGGKDDR